MAGRTENYPPDKRRVNFGKFAGKQFGELPVQYLQWLAYSAFKGQARKQGQPAARSRWALEELKRREALTPRP